MYLEVLYDYKLHLQIVTIWMITIITIITNFKFAWLQFRLRCRELKCRFDGDHDFFTATMIIILMILVQPIIVVRCVLGLGAVQ